MKNKYWSLLLLVLFCSFARAEDSSSVQAVQKLKKALQPTSVGYSGQITVTHWTQQGTHTEDVRVWHQPPNLYRWEFLRPNGDVDRVLWTDGSDERLEVAQGNLALVGRAARGRPKRISNQQEWDLLLSNYHVASLGEESVAGHATRVLELSPNQPGKPYERIWIDKETGVILGVKRYQPQDPLVVLSRFIQFYVSPPDLAAAFENVPREHRDQETIEHGYNSDFLSPEEYYSQTGFHADVPDVLPLGFQLESLDVFEANGHPVVQYHFTDGLNTISVFRTDRPARSCKTASQHQREDLNQTDRAGHVVQGRAGNSYLTLISDLSPRAMRDFMEGFK